MLLSLLSSTSFIAKHFIIFDERRKSGNLHNSIYGKHINSPLIPALNELSILIFYDYRKKNRDGFHMKRYRQRKKFVIFCC